MWISEPALSKFTLCFAACTFFTLSTLETRDGKVKGLMSDLLQKFVIG